MTDFMHDLDSRYRTDSCLSDRRFYKIFYSHLHRFPLLVLGLNPGGETDGTDLAASATYFEGWEHDYVCFRNDSRYALARPMCDLLATALDTPSIDVLRQIPASNVIFRRSRNAGRLNIPVAKAAAETKSFVREILQVVDPRVILLVSSTAYKLFVANHCKRATLREQESTRVYTPNGTYRACIYVAGNAYVPALRRETPLFMVGHPSKFAGRAEWPQVVSQLRQGFREAGVSPIESTGALVPLEPIPAYGRIL